MINVMMVMVVARLIGAIVFVPGMYRVAIRGMDDGIGGAVSSGKGS